MKLELTDRTVATAKPGDLFDSRARGLNLRVTASGTRTWFLMYTAKDGKRARVTLGRYPEIGLARARTLAVEARASLLEGLDPRDMGKVVAHAMTVADLASAFLAKHVRPSLRSSKSIERRLLKNVLPVIGGVKLADLHRREIVRVLDTVVERGARIEANRVFKDIRAMLRWAVRRGDLDSCPTDGMKPPAEEKPRERVLSDDEIAAVWNSTALWPAHRAIIKLCLLTAQRLGEVSGMRIEEVDLHSHTWTIPPERSKNKNQHTVPLTDSAVSIIRESMAAAPHSDKLFPGAGDSSSIGKHIKRADFGTAPWTIHDLRRTAVTGMAQLGVSPIVLAHVINHRSVTKAGVTLGVYQQYEYARERREALELWAERLAAIVRGDVVAEVIPLHRVDQNCEVV